MENREKEIMNILKNIKKINVKRIVNTLRKEMKNYMFWISIHINYDWTFYIDNNNYNQGDEFVLSYDVRNLQFNHTPITINEKKEKLQERIRSDYNQEVISYVRNNLYIDKDEKWKLYIRY